MLPGLSPHHPSWDSVALFITLSLSLAYALCPASAAVVTPRAVSPQVTIDSTTYVGRSQIFGDLLGIDFFGGIPFAESPTGDLRFAPPVAKDVLQTGTIDATQYGAPCAQLNLPGSSEDCLTLNVFRPTLTPSSANLPVLVWIYGGGFAQGFTSIFNATAIISQSILRGTPMIYVSVNYRLGPFGFPQGAEADLQGALNLGLKDQLAALTWVNKHIAAFGGDPSKVTVFGQSAGAMSIADLYLNSGLENLVRGAIFESGSAESLPWFNASRRQVAWDTLTASVPTCTNATQGATFACLRAADTPALLAAWETAQQQLPGLFFVPVLDGPSGLVPDVPNKLIAQGKFAKIPFIAGTNLDEGTAYPPHAIATDEQLVEFIIGAELPFATPEELTPVLMEDIATLLQLYPDDPVLGSPYGTGNETFGLSSQFKRASALAGDAVFQATRRTWIQAASKAGVKTFGYLFADQNAVTDPVLGVTHAAEVQYVYGVPAIASNNSAVRMLSSAMVDYWISFTVSLTPNDGKGLSKTRWPRYKCNNQVLLQLDTSHMPDDSSSADFAIIPDDYRSEQIASLNTLLKHLNV